MPPKRRPRGTSRPPSDPRIADIEQANREDGETTDDRTPEGEEPLTGNPFEFDFGGDRVGNPFAADDNEVNDREGQDEEREH